MNKCQCDKLEAQNKRLKNKIKALKQEIEDIKDDWTASCQECEEHDDF